MRLLFQFIEQNVLPNHAFETEVIVRRTLITFAERCLHLLLMVNGGTSFLSRPLSRGCASFYFIL